MGRRKNWLSVIIAAVVVVFGTEIVSAEREYLPVVEDGKSWVMLEIDLDFPNDTIYYDITVKGDVTVKDTVCRKLSIVERNGDTLIEKAVYEENGVTYFYNGIELEPIFDMKYQKGDIYYPVGMPPISYWEVLDSDVITTSDGKDRKILVIGTNSKPKGVWVEGIGVYGVTMTSSFAMPASAGVTSKRYMQYIVSYLNEGELLFTHDDFKRLLGEYTGICQTELPQPLAVAYTDGSVSAVCDGNSVSLELYSMDGKLIAGAHGDDGRALLETSSLPGGIYIARAANGETTAARKITL